MAVEFRRGEPAQAVGDPGGDEFQKCGAESSFDFKCRVFSLPDVFLACGVEADGLPCWFWRGWGGVTYFGVQPRRNAEQSQESHNGETPLKWIHSAACLLTTPANARELYQLFGPGKTAIGAGIALANKKLLSQGQERVLDVDPPRNVVSGEASGSVNPFVDVGNRLLHFR